MSLETDALLDRRRLKRLLAWWRVATIVLGVALAMVLANRLGVGADGAYVARLSVSGIITDDLERDKALRSVARDGEAKALIVRINSPGGTVVGGEALFRSLRAVAKTKPVVAVMGTLATSAGYMTALGADYIVAHEGTITGSIGVILQATDITGLLDKIGVSTEAIKTSPLKATPSPFEPLTPAAREAARSVIMDVYEMFVDLVASRRDLERDKVLMLADGRVYTGRQALAARLVDQLGGETEARKWLTETHQIDRFLPVREVRTGRFEIPIWRALASILSEKTVFSETLILDGLISLWHPDLR